MLWAIDVIRRPRPPRSPRPRLVAFSARAAEILRYGAGYFGGLEALTFRCPGCVVIHRVGPRQRRRTFNPRTQRFRCPDCGIEMQLSILAEILPLPLTKRAARNYEAHLLYEMACRPEDTVPSIEQAAALRTHASADAPEPRLADMY